MEQTYPKLRDLLFDLTQISKPARRYLKDLTISLLQYHKDFPVTASGLFYSKEDKKEEDFHD